jgi:DNA polymerase
MPMHTTMERCMRYPVVHRDYECRSTVDLKKVGHHVYAADPSTEILVAVWIIEYERDKFSEPIIWHAGDLFSVKVRELIEAGATVTGHNAAFEAAIDAYLAGPRLGWPVPKLSQLDCTLARAAVQALPLDLDRLGQALRLMVQKDKEGHRLMRQMCKPRVPHKGEDPNGVYWHFDADKLARLTEYCITDVRTEIEADHALRPLQDQERVVWLLDQIMNNRGVQIDREFVDCAETLISRALERANARMRAVTYGAVNKVSQISRLIKFAKEHGVELETVEKTRRNGEAYEAERADKEALGDLLTPVVADESEEGQDDPQGALPLVPGKSNLEWREGDPPSVRAAFELRLEAGKSSLAKLTKFKSQAPDGRARGNLQYHGAAPGRWAGRGVQMQNLVRRGITELGGWEQAYRDMQELDDDTFELVWGAPFDVVSRMMRGAVIAAPGLKLYFGDYASVEARGCVWAAGQQDIVELFARDGKIYEETAAKIFGVAVEDVTKEQRFLGKGAVLGCVMAWAHRGFRRRARSKAS